MKPQPARVSYFFKGGYTDIGNALLGSWRASLGPCTYELRRIGDTFSDHHFFAAIFLLLIDLLIFPVVTLIGVAVSLVISTVLLVLFALMMAVIYLLFMLLKTVDTIFCILYRISHKCPRCQQKFMHPVYICPKCNARHDRLVPSKYGIWMRRCNCGQKLPTTFLNGRQKLSAVCPHCQTSHAAAVESNSRDICCIPVIGGRAAGKTCYISSALVGLQQRFTASGWNFRYLYDINDEYADNIGMIRRGVCPPQTGDMRLKYYKFAANKKKKDIQNIITLCDVGGEAYAQGTGAQNITDQIGFRYAEGLLMVIDPLSIPDYRREISSAVSLDGYRGSTKSIDDVLSIVVHTMDNMLKLSYKQKIRTRLAVVFTKCDIPGLDSLIGDEAVRKYRAAHPRISEKEARNRVCLEFLQRYNQQNFVNSLRSKFKDVQFFTCSALGHVQNGQQFSSRGVEEPVLWLLSKCKTPIRLKVRKSTKKRTAMKMKESIRRG
jgi:hypothetical protein